MTLSEKLLQDFNGLPEEKKQEVMAYETGDGKGLGFYNNEKRIGDITKR